MDSELNDNFSKVSSFYKKDSAAEVFEPKKCEFLLKVTNSYGTQVFAQLEYDMATFAGKTDAADTINFPESFFRDTFINVEWTI